MHNFPYIGMLLKELDLSLRTCTKPNGKKGKEERVRLYDQQANASLSLSCLSHQRRGGGGGTWKDGGKEGRGVQRA